MDTAMLDRSVAALKSNADRWACLPVKQKVSFLEQVMDGFVAVMEEQVRRGLEAKGIAPDSPNSADEWLGGPMVTIRNLRLTLRSLREIAVFGRPQLDPSKVKTRPGGQVVVDVFPETILDKITFSGFSAQVWMQPDVKADQLPSTMATFYKDPHPKGSICLVLGAGNVASIAPLDAVYKMFVEGKVCLLKLNPVNDYLGPTLETAFGPLIRNDYMRVVYGGGDVGAHLCKHPDIEEIHITGSDKTHDLIVYGPGEEGAKRKAEDKPLLNKEITSELGNVSPVVVIPGLWSDAELQFHAENIATQMTQNSGYNCNACKVIITHEAWPQRQAFLDKLRSVLRSLPARKAYYPGTHDRYKKFTEGHSQAEKYGQHSDSTVPFTLIPNLKAEEKGEICFFEESFCSVTGEVPLKASDASDFLKKAVDFCNQRLHGTLNACVIVHPKTEAELGDRFDAAIAALRYGSIGINHWPALSYGIGFTTWGAYPGHTYKDIQSGRGIVHNIFMFSKPQKSVIRGPFTIFPKPPWFVTHKKAHKVAPYLAQFEVSPSFFGLAPILFYAVQG